MATQPEDAESTGGRRNPLGRRREGSDAGDEQTDAPEAGDTADEPGIDEQAAEAPAEVPAEATATATVEEPSEPLICAICNDPIDGAHLMAAYGPVHDPGCSSQTKKVP